MSSGGPTPATSLHFKSTTSQETNKKKWLAGHRIHVDPRTNPSASNYIRGHEYPRKYFAIVFSCISPQIFMQVFECSTRIPNFLHIYESLAFEFSVMHFYFCLYIFTPVILISNCIFTSEFPPPIFYSLTHKFYVAFVELTFGNQRN